MNTIIIFFLVIQKITNILIKKKKASQNTSAQLIPESRNLILKMNVVFACQEII